MEKIINGLTSKHVCEFEEQELYHEHFLYNNYCKTYQKKIKTGYSYACIICGYTENNDDSDDDSDSEQGEKN